MSSNLGVLYVVATPIGNIGDITQRALEVLSEVAIVAAEDTRTAKKLLNLVGIRNSCMAYHEHNEVSQISKIQQVLERGDSVALISDAGTPLISDPGYPLVKELIQQGYSVTPIPGVSALVAALSVSGIATDRFIFEGFLPAKHSARVKYLKTVQQESRTLVFYESSHRIKDSLADMRDIIGADRIVTVCRELTKKFETIHQANLADLCNWVEQSNQQKGEFVIIISGFKGNSNDDLQAASETLTILLDYLGPSQAAAATAQITGIKKKKLYQLALEIKGDE